MNPWTGNNKVLTRLADKSLNKSSGLLIDPTHPLNHKRTCRLTRKTLCTYLPASAAGAESRDSLFINAVPTAATATNNRLLLFSAIYLYQPQLRASTSSSESKDTSDFGFSDHFCA